MHARDPFMDPFADPFFSGGMLSRGHGGFGGAFSQMDRMMDDMLKSPHGSTTSSYSMSSSSFSSGGPGGMLTHQSKSISQKSYVDEHGRRVTVTTTTIRHPDGREETTTDE